MNLLYVIFINGKTVRIHGGSMSVDEINRKLDELVRYAESEFKRISSELESIINEVKTKGDALAFNTSILKLRKEIRELIRNLRVQLREIRRSSRELSKDARELIIERVEDFEDEVSYMLDELLEKLDEVRESFKGGKVGLPALVPPLSDIFKATTSTLSNLSKTLAEAFNEVRAEVEKGIVKDVSTVVSVRVSEQDLKVIDLLVNVGVFKSRSEAISFFIRKGIKASEDLLKKVRERIEELSKLVNELEGQVGKS